MKDKFTKVLSLIFIILLIVFMPMIIYFKNNFSNITLLNNKVFVSALFVIACVFGLTGVMLMLTGLCYIRDSLSSKQNIRLKKKQLIVGMIIICIVFVPLIINSWNNKSNSQSKKDDISQINKNDNSEDNQQSNDSTDEPNNIESSSTSKQTETVKQPVSDKLRSDDGNLELENNYCSDGKICGNIKNLSSDSYRYVEVDINLYDASGNQVDSILTNVNNLEGNTNWNFNASVMNQNKVSKYKVVSIKGTR